MGYVVGLGLQNPEMKILFQSDIRLLRNVEVLEINNFGNNFLFNIFLIFVEVQLPIWRLIIYA